MTKGEQNLAVLYKSELNNTDMCDMMKKRLYIIYKVSKGVKSTTCFWKIYI